MIECGSLEYAQARVNARHGERLREADWRRIEVLREFGPLLELARGTALRPWLSGITQDSTVHQIEVTLRDHWHALVDEVSAWMPGPWRPALAWCAVLPDLAALQHLASGGEPTPWMRQERAWRELGEAEPQERAALLRTGPLAALAGAWSAPQQLGQAWQDEWRRRCPKRPQEDDDTLEQLRRTLLDHGLSFAAAAAGQGWLLRGSLRAQLALLLRRATLEPAAAFIHIALSALDLERLRAELMRRVVFPRWKVA